MKRILLSGTIVISLLTGTSHLSIAQRNSRPKNKVALFVPLYLDEAFDSAGIDKLDFKTFPRQALPGLEFYNGAKLALDSLEKEKTGVEVYVYDSRSAATPLEQILKQPVFDSIQMIIGAVSNPEMKTLSDAAALRNIPFISATYPNDGGVTGNPFTVILNGTLRTHIEGLYQYLKKNYANQPLLVFSKKGVQEDKIRAMLADCNKNAGANALSIKTIALDQGITRDSLQQLLDTAVKTVCIAATFDELYTKGLVSNLAALSKKYPVVVVGMPNWENWKELDARENRNLEIIYSTSFYTEKKDRVSNIIAESYKQIQSKPTDAVFKGYEVMYHFIRLLHKYDIEIVSHLKDKDFTVFTSFDIQPVGNKKNIPYYLENRKLYFIRKWNGETRLAP